MGVFNWCGQSVSSKIHWISLGFCCLDVDPSIYVGNMLNWGFAEFGVMVWGFKIFLILFKLGSLWDSSVASVFEELNYGDNLVEVYYFLFLSEVRATTMGFYLFWAFWIYSEEVIDGCRTQFNRQDMCLRLCLGLGMGHC